VTAPRTWQRVLVAVIEILGIVTLALVILVKGCSR
jgi:hypothetical protein